MTTTTATTILKGSNINFDFDAIKTNLKTFLSSQTTFQDYDFESSGMSVLLDILAYNTQMNAMTAHLSLNEIFLDSAQARPNIVSLAKQLGYTPTSVASSIATINFTVIPPTSFIANTLTLPQNISFSGGGLDWYVTESQTVTKNANGNFAFTDVNIREGVRKVVRYYFDGKNPHAKFEIPDRDIDTTTLEIAVRESETATLSTSYSPFSVFSEIDDETPIYFLEENASGRYEFYFTGGNVGISPTSGNIIEAEYFFSVGAAANGISLFNTNSKIASSIERQTVTLVSASTGGSDKESVESIRFNAPHFFEAQNRCVSFNDYAAIIKKEFPQTQSINVWGGEDTSPAEYGKVYICVKPTQGETLSDASKTYILDEILKQRKVSTITPELVDPEYTYIGLDIVAKYDDSKTKNSPQTIANIIRNEILTYNSTKLQEFNGVFRHSKLLTLIDNAEFSIQNTVARIVLIKKITLSAISDNEFALLIPSEFYDYDPDNAFIKSTPIRINNQMHYITDRIDPNDSTRRQLILVYTGSTGNQILENLDIGYIDIATKYVYLYGFRPDATSNINLYINPKSNDIMPIQNQLLLVDTNEISIQVKRDIVRSLYSSVTDADYTPTPKNTTFFE